ncbi:rod shape-determining protein RodA, partial [Staphylococcus arlettae]
GNPLQFISHCCSSLWSLMCGIGIIFSISYHQPKQYTTQSVTSE